MIKSVLALVEILNEQNSYAVSKNTSFSTHIDAYLSYLGYSNVIYVSFSTIPNKINNILLNSFNEKKFQQVF